MMSVTHSSQRSLQNCRRFVISHIGHLCIFTTCTSLAPWLCQRIPQTTESPQRFNTPASASTPHIPTPPSSGWLPTSPLLLSPSSLPLSSHPSSAVMSPSHAAISSSITPYSAVPCATYHFSCPHCFAAHGHSFFGPRLVGEAASFPGLHRLIDIRAHHQ